MKVKLSNLFAICVLVLVVANPSLAQIKDAACKTWAVTETNAGEARGSNPIVIESSEVSPEVFARILKGGAAIYRDCANNGCPGTNNNSDDCISNCGGDSLKCNVCCNLVNYGDSFAAGECKGECDDDDDV